MPENTHIRNSSPSDPDALRVLIRDCISGKRTSQRLLYETYAPAAWNTIRRYVYKNEHAQEILNDVFFKVFTRLEQYNRQGAFEAWIRRIAVNTLTDHLRKNITKEQTERTLKEEEDVFIDGDAVSNINFKELVEFTYKLPDMHRAVFNLYVFENMSHKEIGQSLDISEGNSRWILNDARKRLKQMIMQYTK